MSNLISTTSQIAMLTRILTREDFVIKLFVDDHNIIAGDVAGNFTEMSTQGYVPKVLTGTLSVSTWELTTVDREVSALYKTDQVWAWDGTGGTTLVYGYYIVDQSNVLQWAQRFDTPSQAVAVLDSLTITPVFLWRI